MSATNRRIVLRERPEGAPDRDTFALEETPRPEPDEGEILCRTIWLSLDPYMRGRISAAKSYAAPVEIGEVMTGEVVAEVMESRVEGLRPGDVVRARGGWQEWFAVPAADAAKIDPAAAPLSHRLGVLGMPGLTAYAALFAIAEPKPGETVVVPAAAGAVGAVAGQIARIKGCRAIGIAGGPEKCTYVTDELGFDACLDRRAPGLGKGLIEACPNGVDIYLETVGGPVLDAVLPLMNMNGRIPVVGGIAHYNQPGPPEGPDRLPLMMRQILVKRLLLKGLLVFDHEAMRPDFEREVGQWIKKGRIKYREDVVEGLEKAPEAFIGMLEGRNFGKLVVKVGAEPEG